MERNTSRLQPLSLRNRAVLDSLGGFRAVHGWYILEQYSAVCPNRANFRTIKYGATIYDVIWSLPTPSWPHIGRYYECLCTELNDHSLGTPSCMRCTSLPYLGRLLLLRFYRLAVTLGFLDVERRNGGLEFAHPVKICNNCWIGAGVNILPGVTIGEGCVIGAGSVVTKDIPANSLAVGVPAKVVKKLNDEAEREEAKKSA